MVNDWNDETGTSEIGNVHFITLELVSTVEMYKLKDKFDNNYYDALKLCIGELHDCQLLNYKTIDKILNAFGINESFDYDKNEEVDEEAIKVYSPEETYKRFDKIKEAIIDHANE